MEDEFLRGFHNRVDLRSFHCAPIAIPTDKFPLPLRAAQRVARPLARPGGAGPERSEGSGRVPGAQNRDHYTDSGTEEHAIEGSTPKPNPPQARVARGFWEMIYILFNSTKNPHESIR